MGVTQAQQELVDSFMESYGDRYKGVLDPEELRATLLALKPSQLAAFVVEAANGFDEADLVKQEAQNGVKWGRYGFEPLTQPEEGEGRDGSE